MNDKSVIGKPRISLVSKEGLVIPDKTIIQPGEIGATLEWTVREGIFNPEGKITEHHGPIRSESFVRQFLDLLYLVFTNDYSPIGIEITSTAGVLQRVNYQYNTFNCDGGIGILTKGIIVGTDNTAPNITNFALVVPIAHGGGGGQMNYSTMTFASPASDATTSQITLTRNFANASGGAITVKEIALYCHARRFGIAVISVMLIRDVIGGGILVPNGQTLTVNYRPQAVV